jgi:MFS family permease
MMHPGPALKCAICSFPTNAVYAAALHGILGCGRDYVKPRPILMAVAQAGMALGHVLLAIGCPGSLYIGSLLVGFGYGSHWSVIPATASELFGLKNFGILYNVLCVANPAGSLIFSGLIAGTLYDHEAQKQRGLTTLATSFIASDQLAIESDEVLLCKGAICFRETLFIMAGVCIIGIVLNLVLVARTQRVYIMLYGKTGGRGCKG